jgi:tetratricopeptide (TPR) repeat protein
MLAAALLAAGAGAIPVAAAEDRLSGAPLEEGRRLLAEATDAFFEQALPSAELRGLLQSSEEAFARMPDEAARLYWQAEAQYLLGFVEQADGRPDQAQLRFEKGRDLLLASLARRESSQACRLLADTYAQLLILNGLLYKMSYGPKVRELAEAALRLDPANAKARLTLALFYKNAPAVAGGSRAKSLQLLHSLEKEGELERVDRFSLNAWLGIAYSEGRRPEEARRYLARALEVYSGNAWIRDLLGRLSP